MGIALPLFGYMVPKGQRTVAHDPTSGWNRNALEGISDFGRTLRRLAPSLRNFIYPSDLPPWPDDLIVETVIETDDVERPGLRYLLSVLKGDAPGSIVVPNLEHLQLSRSHFEGAGHRALLVEIVEGLAPVFTIQLGSGRNLVTEITRDPSNAYFTMADNYARNRQTLEKHLAQFSVTGRRNLA